MINIDWLTLLEVTAVSLVASVVFVALLAGGIRYVSAARVRTNQGMSGSSRLAGGYSMLALAGALVLYGLYRIIPIFH
jgi:hypothetical protein